MVQVIMTKLVRFLGVLNTESLLDPCGRLGFEKAFRGVARSGSAPRVARWGTAPGVARSGTAPGVTRRCLHVHTSSLNIQK